MARKRTSFLALAALTPRHGESNTRSRRRKGARKSGGWRVMFLSRSSGWCKDGQCGRGRDEPILAWSAEVHQTAPAASLNTLSVRLLRWELLSAAEPLSLGG